MGKLTLCNKDLIGDIPTVEISSHKEMRTLIEFWLRKKDFNNSVFVCFQSHTNIDYRDEHQTCLISHNKKDIIDICDILTKDKDIETLDFNIFESESYEEALGYYSDLKEGV